MNQEVRLNKYLASCGVGSRRACDEIIQAARVQINGEPVIKPAVQVQPGDHVRVDGKLVAPKEVSAILINKPRGLVSTCDDELGRETIYSILPPKLRHLKHVGRLDRDSEGLLVMTNDGDLAQLLTHPKKTIEKEYVVTLNQAFGNEVLDKMIEGVYTPEGKARAKSIRRISPRRVVMVLETGLKRQIRMMFQAVHLRVSKLVRVRIGTLVGGGLEPGEYRELEERDIEKLQRNPKPRTDISPTGQKLLDSDGRVKRTVAKKTFGARKSARKRPAGNRPSSGRPSGGRPSSGRPPSGGPRKFAKKRKK
ncbi:pseudouridine synthase [Persicirhabdus sediminis]|uniref:Pseudouridine synthase n=1 Tax=Persicirhabdus sediminis TaxID=454144 RepID=A0A8J7MDZ7_9BACT|nr:pseudouridine synthase [Persicirhabdus sediminis]MBK1790783.1 rRNA pseudouridine synthase [Persicirhabdus sediminis]